MAKKERTDPVEEAADGSMDLYDVATWDERTSLDGLVVALYRVISGSARLLIIALGLLLLVGIGGISILSEPGIAVLTLLSAVPALALAAYVYRSDVASGEPLYILVATFLLGVLTANFAAVINGYTQQYFAALGFVGTVLSYYLVVGPVEETVKLLAVRLYAFGDETFDSVLDGAVYGAMAGLGFAFIENALYISRAVDVATLDLGLGLIGAGGDIAFTRALAGPGHVIYSAFAGYYLGLAKFNPDDRGPIVLKGLLIATLIHATYNTTVGIGAYAIQTALGLVGIPTFGGLLAYLGYVVVYQGLFGLLLVRKIRNYRRAYHRARDSADQQERATRSEMTEFDG
ncbi:PrsW family intramembrane metalloprotease [Candidatus Halobonum tyrrellensis]|uniref:PrsW family intramembrane metalloprotease n=1 Tax=Candidatus Halobonum tyrrellensis G22 TaxID=1324957 RepID=V4HA32_9EURY|nr:PrsW family intramembrane metalloprotease [Candidatus Halobonum tyrrellensis]ESP87575.1 hypothetical protein K933_13364 [Candidatus Halobonum tyrrellensis G22]